MYNVAVVGMGYVGIPEALIIANSDVVDRVHGKHRVYGIQRDSIQSGHKIAELNVGILPFKDDELLGYLKTALMDRTFQCTPSYSCIEKYDVVIIAVQTPVDIYHNFDLINLFNIVDKIIEHIKDKTILIIASTVPPGTTDRIASVIQKSGKNVYVAHAPERVMPGKLIENHHKYPRIIGGVNQASILHAMHFYNDVYDEKVQLFPTTSINAELIKTGENAVRDAQIAISNQLACICEDAGGNYYTVKQGIDTLKDVPRCLLMPGLGVGGPCLTKDGYLLLNQHGMFSVAREVNESMPRYIFSTLNRELLANGIKREHAKVAIFGLAYTPNSEDTRNSPTTDFIRICKDAGIEDVRVYDPHCCDVEGVWEFPTVLQQVDAIVVATAHNAFNAHWCCDMDLMKSKMNQLHPPIFIDARNVLSNVYPKYIKSGWVYSCIGRGDL